MCTPRTFSDYVDGHTPAGRELPLVHTTECERLTSICASNRIEPHHCGVFDEPLLYMFYGRPAFRDPSRTTPSRDVSYCPVCFVFRPPHSRAIKRLYPFDTGASEKGFYEPEIPAANGLADYSLQTVIDRAQRIVHAFFETNENYMRPRPRTGLCFAPEDVDAEAYHKLISTGGNPECDDRKSAVEVQLAGAVDLRDQLLAVALPTSFLDDEDFRRTLMTEWRAHPLTYSADVGTRPTECHGLVRKLIKDYYETWRLL